MVLKTVVWSHFATVCCKSRNQAVLSMMKKHCYSGLRAEGVAIENILANKQRFIGTIEAGAVHGIMQWNLTGLCRATRSEELINVWGSAGVICTLVDVPGTHAEAVILNTEPALSRTTCHLCTKHQRDITAEMRAAVTANTCVDSHIYRCLNPPPRASWSSWSAGSLAPRDGLLVVKNDLPLLLFPPQLPVNIMKKGSLIGPHARCHSPTTLRLSSAATTAKLLPRVIYSVSGRLLYHPGSHRADRRVAEMHRGDYRGPGLRRATQRHVHETVSKKEWWTVRQVKELR